MQETEMHHALKEYVTDEEPAMTLTADAVLAAGRRSRRTRRLAGSAGAGLAAALLGTGLIVMSGSSSTNADFAAAVPCPVPPGPRPPGAIAANRALTPELVQWAATSLTCYLNEEVPRLLPAATFARQAGNGNAQAKPLTGFSLGGEPPFGNRVDSLTLIRDAQGTGNLTVTVRVVNQTEAALEKDSCQRDENTKCTAQTGPSGETVLLGTERDPLPAGSPRNFVVRVYRGHSEIYVQASNTDDQPVNYGSPAVTRPKPILSANQAVQLALSPELYLFP